MLKPKWVFFSRIVFLIFLADLLAGSGLATMYFSDSFESGDKSHSDNGIVWDLGGNGEICADIANTGTHSMRFFFPATAPGEDCDAEQRMNLGPNYLTEVYFRWYQYFPAGTEPFCPGGPCNKWLHRVQGGSLGSDNNKWFMMWADDYTGTGRVNVGWHFWPTGDGSSSVTPGAVQQCGDLFIHDWEGCKWVLDDAFKGRWFCVEMHFRINTSESSPNGQQRMWIDGQLYYDSGAGQPWPLPMCADNWFHTLYLMGWANSGFDLDSYTYIDDFVISDAYIGPIGSPSISPQPPRKLRVGF